MKSQLHKKVGHEMEVRFYVVVLWGLGVPKFRHTFVGVLNP